MARRLQLCALLALLASFNRSAHAELLMVYSIQRHGARNVLPKSATLKESDAAGGPTLLPQGQRQAWEAGAAYHARYLNASTCGQGAISTCLADPSTDATAPHYGVVATAAGAFNNYNTLVRASALDRAIMTARSFLDAVFPPIPQRATAGAYLPDGQQVVPVYSLPENQNPLTRAYTACPAYDARLEAWYASDEFAAKAAESQALRDSVAALGVNMDTSLQRWWNVYDAFNVYQTYGVGSPQPNVTDAGQLQQMQELAHWLETRKMRSELTGALLAGPLLADLLAHLEAAQAAVGTNSVEPMYYKLVHLSGHYNTMLGLLGALGLDRHPAAADLIWLWKMPALAALLAFELHGDTSATPAELAVRLVMQDGPDAPYTPIPLPCAQDGEGAQALAGAGACALLAFVALVRPLALDGPTEWCDACENGSMQACQLRQAQRQLAAAASAGSGGGLSSGAWAGILVGCVAPVSAVFGVVLVLQHRRMQRRLELARLLGDEAGAGALPQSV